MIKYVILGIIISWSTISQSQQVIFEKNYGDNSNQKARSVTETSDGGFAITGSTDSNDEEDLFIIKTDVNGEIEWEKTYEIKGTEIGYSIKQSSDGGFIICGFKEAPDSRGGGYIVKTDINGVVEWTKVVYTYSNFNNNNYDVTLHDIIETNSGEIVAVGDGYWVEFSVFRLSASGDIIWSKALEPINTADRSALGVVETKNNDVLVSGEVNTSFAKFNSDGDVLIDTVYNNRYGSSIVKGDNDNYYILADSLLKINSNGDILRKISYNIENLYFKRSSFSLCYIDSKDQFGLIGSQTYYENGNRTDSINSTIAIINQNGSLLWEKHLFSSKDEEGLYSIISTSDGKIVICGIKNSYNGNSDVFLMKLSTPDITSVAENEFPNVKLYPTNVKKHLTINTEEKINNATIRIINTMGKVVHQICDTDLHTETRIDLSKLYSGIYFIELKSEDLFTQKTFIKH